MSCELCGQSGIHACTGKPIEWSGEAEADLDEAIEKMLEIELGEDDGN